MGQQNIREYGVLMKDNTYAVEFLFDEDGFFLYASIPADVVGPKRFVEACEYIARQMDNTVFNFDCDYVQMREDYE